MYFSLARWIVPVSCVALLVPVLASARVSDASTGLRTSAQVAGLSSACSGTATECIASLLGRVLNILFGFLGIILLGYILYGGFVWMTAGGNGKEVAQAQDIIRNAVIGVIIIASSFAISNFVLGRLGEIAGVGGSTSGTAGTTGSNGQASIDQLGDGAARLCCYGNPLPARTCVDDCKRSPSSFGLGVAPRDEACILACSSRLCTAGTQDDPKPLPGQVQCNAGSPTERPTTGAVSGGVVGTGAFGSIGPTAFQTAFCAELEREAGTVTDRCRICANGCLADICMGTFPVGMSGGPSAPAIDTESRATAVRTRCEREVCGTLCTR